MALKFDSLPRFLILLYKGFLLRKRHYIITALEIIFPVLLASIPAIIQSEVSSLNYSSQAYWVNDTIYPSFDPFASGHRPYYLTKQVFAYTPSNAVTHKLMKDSVKLWQDSQDTPYRFKIKAFDNPEDLDHYCMTMRQQDNNLIAIGTIFNSMQSDRSNLPSHLDYTIRYNYLYWSGFVTERRFRYSYATSRYSKDSFFLSWQAAVERTFIQQKMVENNKTFDYELWMREFPFPRHKEIPRNSNAKIMMPIVISFGIIVFMITLMRTVNEEMSNGSKEIFKMMGMSDSVFWLSTFLNYFVVGAIIFLIILIIYKAPLKESVVMLEHSDFFLLFIVFLLFTASLILFCLSLTTFFIKAIFGIVFMIIVYCVGYALLAAFVFQIGDPEVSYYPLSFFAKFCICLFPPGAIMTIFELILTYEDSGEGVQWTNLHDYSVIHGFNMSCVMLALLFSCFLYSVIIWYIDAVWPWQYGVSKPFYFPFMKSYWFGYEEKKVNEILLGLETDITESGFFEEDPVGVAPGITITNLSKVFRTGLQTKVAVKNMSLNIYNGQITALLGHNGAGKTTSINILTGLFSPSSGSASINGYDIFSQTSKARQSLGVCPQHNVLYDTLTVEEHLKLYAALKGVKWSEIDEEVHCILTKLNLVDKKCELTKNLSGGMKRKLSLGMAIIGDSKVLFLDEPTSGMDVESRRKVWDTLLEIRRSRTIVLTTHSMEEADVLGDRIAIMAAGELQCCGSPLFLKRKFGTGYHLHVVKTVNFDISLFMDLLAKFIPEAILESESEGEATFNLMSNSRSSLKNLFAEIESRKETLGISSCGVTVTTLDDVFLNVACLSDIKVKEKVCFDKAAETEMKEIYIESTIFKENQKFGNQFLALVVKRMHYSKRHFGLSISQFVLPFLFLCFCLFLIQIIFNKSASEPPLKLDIKEVYGKTDGFYHSDSDPLSKSVANEVKNVLQERKVNVKLIDDPEGFILNYGSQNLADYYKRLMVGGSVESSSGKLNLTAWYNRFPYHSEPMALLLMNTAILKTVTGSGHITLTNHPLPYIDRYFYNYYTGEKIISNVFVTLAMLFLSSSFILVPIHERISKAKLLQMMTGISTVTYWFSMFIWDFFLSIAVSLLLIIPFAIFNRGVFFGTHSEAIGTAVLIFIAYSWSAIPFSYLFSLIFNRPKLGFCILSGISAITGMVAGSILPVYLQDDRVYGNNVVIVFLFLLRLFPSYCLSSGFSNLLAMSYSNTFCESFNPRHLKYICMNVPTYTDVFKCCKDLCGDDCLTKSNPITFQTDACGQDILVLFSTGFIYFLLLLMLESKPTMIFVRYVSQHISNLCNFRNRITDQYNVISTEDSDVLEEEERVRNSLELILNSLSLSEALVVVDLTKKFKNIQAVDHLTFGINKKECFGLLGVNGAGKTTAFRMLTGDCYPDKGNAYIGNYSVTHELRKFQSHIGYCPQFDALIDRLSAREMITLFARLRGLSGPRMTRYVNALIKMTDLTQYADKPSMIYSAGNKRKLSVALALIGAPPLLLLDEPTVGVDPISRRKIWKILSLAKIHSGAAVLLTSHSMEECEALCNRLAIMVNGSLRCLGSIQHLKSKYGKGYTLILKINKGEEDLLQSIKAVKTYIDTHLPGASLKNDHKGVLQYHVVNPSLTLSNLFGIMDDMKESCDLEDYFISDTSLEQIFLTFSKSQEAVIL